MEIFLALAGIAGLSLLLSQSKALPSEADFKKAQTQLSITPDDTDANTVCGKYLAFSLGDYQGAMPYLAKSSDKTLKSLAEHEMDKSYTDTAVKKVGMGDEWVIAAKSFPPLSRIFYDRASQFYSAAWASLDEVWKEKARIQGRKLSASRPPGGVRKGLPQGWKPGTWPGARAPILDGTAARTGSYSIRILPPDQKVKGSYSQIKSDVFQISGAKSIDVSAYVMSDGTEDETDRVYVNFTGAKGKWLGSSGPFIQVDLPFWKRVSETIQVPDGAVQVEFWVVMYSKSGSILVDDVSMKVDGKEVLVNRSFEQ